MRHAFASLQLLLVDPECSGSTVLNMLIDYSSRSDLFFRLVIELCYNVVISIVQVSV